MCYSTRLIKSTEEIEKTLNADMAIKLLYQPYHYLNGFTHKNLFIIKMDQPDMIFPAMWGFIPKYARKDIPVFQKQYNTLNAKSENIFTSNTYKESALAKRCLILADGFHEPHHFNGRPYPYFCHYKDDGLFCFAGLYSELDNALFSCTIVTQPANDQFKEIHNLKKRQPLVLDAHSHNDWLDSRLHEKGLQELMKVCFTTKEIEAYPVTKDIYKKGFDTNTPISYTKVEYPEFNTLF